MRMTDPQITAATDALRALLQESSMYTLDAMDICLRAAARFAMDGCDHDIAADRFCAAAEVIAESLRRGKERRLDS
jgi:hypothetical protein